MYEGVISYIPVLSYHVSYLYQFIYVCMRKDFFMIVYQRQEFSHTFFKLKNQIHIFMGQIAKKLQSYLFPQIVVLVTFLLDEYDFERNVF